MLTEAVKRMLRILCCKLGYHFHGKWNNEGITCEDCGHHKSKAEVMSSLYGGEGW